MSRRIAFLLALAMLGCQSKSERPAAHSTASPDSPVIAEALSLLEQGEIASGIDLLDAAILGSPNEARLYGARATLHHRAGQMSLAMKDLDRALELTPDDAQLLNNRGFLRLSLQQFDSAVADLDRALERQPGYSSASNNRGLVSLALGNEREAVEWFSRALAESPEYVDAWNNRGFAWMQLGRWEDAIADLNHALRLSPKYVNALHNRGLLKARVGERQSAILDFTEAMMLDPYNPRYYEHRGQVYALLGRPDEARADALMLDWLLKLEVLNRTVTAQPRNAAAWAKRAWHYQEHGDEARARHDLAQAVKIDPRQSTVMVMQARLAMSERRYADVLQFTAEILDSDDGAAAASVRGDAFLAQGRYDEALACYASARRFDGSVAEAYFRKSQALASQGDSAAAQEQLDLAQGLDPDIAERLNGTPGRK